MILPPSNSPPVTWRPHDGPQTFALTCDHFEVLYGGARGGGKTDAGMAWLLRDIDNPRYRALVIRKNSIDLSDWIDRARYMYRGTGAKFTGSPGTIIFPSGARIVLGHLQDKNAYAKYQGHEYHRMLIEELTQIPAEKLYEQLIQSCRSTVLGLTPHVFATTNPGGLGHGWVKARFIDVAPWNTTYIDQNGNTRIFVPARVEDNPSLMHNDPSYVKRLMSISDPALREAWLKGNWDVFDGQYFREFKRDIHVVKPEILPSHWHRFISIDYGYSAPSAVYWHAVNDDNEVFTYRELYVTGLIYKKLAERIVEMNGGEKIEYAVADPAIWAPSKSTGESGSETMQNVFIETKSGISLTRGDNSRIAGWQRMREYLLPYEGGNKAQWKIFETCLNLIRELPGAVYDQTIVEDLDTTGSDHALDSCRYFLMSRPYKRPDRVPKDTQVVDMDSSLEQSFVEPEQTESWDD